MPLVAVDGGGTGCRVAVGTAAAGVQATATGGPANVSNDFEAAIANIVAAAHEAASQAGWNSDRLGQATAHLGLAGADLAATQKKTQANLPFGRVRISGDRLTTVTGVLGTGDGSVVALGTGTIIARQVAGQLNTVSGWGFQLSDKASGAWLGRMMLTRVLDAAEGLEPESPFSKMLADRMGGVRGIFDYANSAGPQSYAKLAPEIFAAGEKGDAIARDLLQTGADYVARGLTVLGFAKGETLCLAGGVGPHYAPYLPDTLTGNLQAPKGNALDGAFALAHQFAGS